MEKITTQDGLTRQERGMEIARTSRITKNKLGWKVPSQTGSGHYVVSKDHDFCTCPDFEKHGVTCKHIHAVEFVIQRKVDPDGTVTETKAVRVTYSQDWNAYNQAQTQEKRLFQGILHDLCKGLPDKQQTVGRPQTSTADKVFAAALKVYSTVSGRRATCDLKDAANEGLMTHAPHYNSISNYLEDQAFTAILKNLIEKSAQPLKGIESNFALDSSGFSTSTYSRWFDEKYGKERRCLKSKRQWLKAHLMTGVKTNIVTSVEVTPKYVHDSTQLPALVERTSRGFDMNEVSADKAYLSNSNLAVIEKTGATPFIPFKSNTTGSGSTTWEKLYCMFTLHQDEFLIHYHKRSNVETTFFMIKAKFGAFVRSKSMTAQVNEILLKVLCHNICVLVSAIFENNLQVAF